jgi:hypothetical protein
MDTRWPSRFAPGGYGWRDPNKEIPMSNAGPASDVADQLAQLPVHPDDWVRLKPRLYCEREGCPVRTIEISVKDTQGLLIERLRHQALHCPICHGAALSVHEVLTLDQSGARDAREARESVNTQMWQRDHAIDSNPWSRAVPVAVLLDDRLPPTPEGWFERMPRSARREEPR